jgi:anti-sigma B factor antagonist
MADLSAGVRLFIVNRDAEALLEVGGELDLATADALREHLDLIVEGGTGDVVVDMSAVTFCDSVTLCLLVGAAGRLQVMGRSLRMLNPSACVIRLLQLTGLDGLLASQPSPGSVVERRVGDSPNATPRTGEN